MARKRRILAVSYYYPPHAHVGAARWAAMARHLERLGHEVTVLTTRAYGRLPNEGHEVVRAADLVGSPLLRRALRRPPLAAVDGGLVSSRPPLIDRVVVPDGYLLSWVPAAALAARRLIPERGIDCVITSSPPESAHMVALMLGRRRPAWVAELRDAWSRNPARRPAPTALQRRLEARLERLVTERADGVITVAGTVASDLNVRLAGAATRVPHGGDPDLEPEVARAASALPALPRDRLVIAHTGRLSGAWGRNPVLLARALERLAGESPELGERLLLVLAGDVDAQQWAPFEAAAARGLVLRLGRLARPAAAALQRRADALVLVGSRDLPFEAPVKLVEYLAARKPVLAISGPGEAADVIAATGAGLLLAPDDEAGLVKALRQLAERRLEDVRPDREAVAQYVYPRPAELLAEQVESAIAAHRSREEKP